MLHECSVYLCCLAEKLSAFVKPKKRLKDYLTPDKKDLAKTNPERKVFLFMARMYYVKFGVYAKAYF